MILIVLYTSFKMAFLGLDGPITLFSLADGISVPCFSIMCILWSLFGAATGLIMLAFHKTFLAGIIIFGTMCLCTWAGAALFLIESRLAASANL